MKCTSCSKEYGSTKLYGFVVPQKISSIMKSTIIGETSVYMCQECIEIKGVPFDDHMGTVSYSKPMQEAILKTMKNRSLLQRANEKGKAIQLKSQAEEMEVIKKFKPIP